MEVGMMKDSKRIDNEADRVGTEAIGQMEWLMAREAGRLKVSNTAW